MGLDRDLARAFASFCAVAIVIGLAGTGLLAWISGTTDALRLFLPVLVGYGIIVAGFSAALALYTLVRSRSSELS